MVATTQETFMIDIAKIRTDGDTQNRAYMSGEVAKEYAGAMESGAEFPPITLIYDGSQYWIVDGYHRLEAAKSLGRPQILATVEFGTLEDAQWQSFGVNAAHGIRRSHQDKAIAVKAAIKHPHSAGMSLRAIAEHTGVDHHTVKKYWDELKYAGENPHDAKPPVPVWLARLNTNRLYVVNKKTKVIYDSPFKSYDGAPRPWGIDPGDVSSTQGSFIAENAAYWEFDLVPLPPDGAPPEWLAAATSSSSYEFVVDHDAKLMYPIATEDWNFRKPAKSVEQIQRFRIVQYPWIFADYALVDVNSEAYQQMVERLIAAGNRVKSIQPVSPSAATEVVTAPDLGDGATGSDDEINPDEHEESSEDEDENTEVMIPEAAHQDIGAALSSFGDMIAAICKSYDLTFDEMMYVIEEEYSIEDAILDALRTAKESA